MNRTIYLFIRTFNSKHYLVQHQILIETHTGQRHPEVIAISRTLLSLHFREFDEAVQRQPAPVQLHFICNEIAHVTTICVTIMCIIRD